MLVLLIRKKATFYANGLLSHDTLSLQTFVAVWNYVVEMPTVLRLCTEEPENLKGTRSCEQHLRDYRRLSSSFLLCMLFLYTLEVLVLQAVKRARSTKYLVTSSFSEQMTNAC